MCMPDIIGSLKAFLAMQMLESFWLKSSAFVAGEEISIADLLMVTELDMLHMLAGSDQVQYTLKRGPIP